MMSKIYANNFARSNSDSSRGTAGRGVAMQAMGQDLSKINCHYCNTFDHDKNGCADFKAARQQNGRRRQRQHKQRGGHQPDQPKPGEQHQYRGGGQIWCSYHKTTTHNDADCRARLANGLNGNVHIAQVRPPSVPGICSSWDFPVRDNSNEEPCILFLAREVQPAAKPTQSSSGGGDGARPFGPVRTAATKCGQLAPGHLFRVLSLTCDQARQSPSRGGDGSPAIRPGFDSSDGEVENSPLAICSAC